MVYSPKWLKGLTVSADWWHIDLRDIVAPLGAQFIISHSNIEPFASLVTRDPNTGERALYGEYLTNAQGEDVVAGVRTPSKISHMRDELPEVYAQFEEIAERLEGHYRDMQDMEFTIERGKLYMLQTRSGKRTAPAAVKIAVDMVNEGVLSKEEALQRIDPAQIVQLLLPRFDEAAKATMGDRLLGKGLNASPGAAVGQAIFDPDRAVEAKEAGNPVILVRIETSPDDVHGMLAAQGVVTSRGGRTSHAALVALNEYAFAVGSHATAHVPFLLFIAFFVWIGASQEASMVQMRNSNSGIPVTHAMQTQFETLSPSDRLDRVVSLILAGSQQDFLADQLFIGALVADDDDVVDACLGTFSNGEKEIGARPIGSGGEAVPPAIVELPPPIFEAEQRFCAWLVVVAGPKRPGLQVSRPFCVNLMSLSKSTFAFVVGFGTSLYGLGNPTPWPR